MFFPCLSTATDYNLRARKNSQKSIASAVLAVQNQKNQNKSKQNSNHNCINLCCYNVTVDTGHVWKLPTHVRTESMSRRIRWGSTLGKGSGKSSPPPSDTQSRVSRERDVADTRAENTGENTPRALLRDLCRIRAHPTSSQFI